MNKKQLIYLLTALFAAAMMASCGGNGNKLKYPGSTSSKTGFSYKKSGMEKELKYKEPAPAPGLVLIPGGTFVMGGGEKDIEFTMDNRQRQVTVMSFYLDETEIANIDWKEFLQTGLSDSAGVRGDEFRASMYPDTNVWRRDLAFNDPIAETYFNHPAFNMFPVVGITWHQANEYCKWRTNIVNSDLKKNQVAYPSYRLPTEAVGVCGPCQPRERNLRLEGKPFAMQKDSSVPTSSVVVVTMPAGRVVTASTIPTASRSQLL
ncbi:MAG: SUMF1/EgtB/PvdO family nonheme iron enzyme [Bacteroidia bacterium]